MLDLFPTFLDFFGNIEKCPFTYWLNGRWFLQLVDGDSGNLYPIYIYIKQIVVLASEPVGGRSRATELPCLVCFHMLTIVYIIPFVAQVYSLKLHQNISLPRLSDLCS